MELHFNFLDHVTERIVLGERLSSLAVEIFAFLGKFFIVDKVSTPKNIYSIISIFVLSQQKMFQLFIVQPILV